MESSMDKNYIFFQVNQTRFSPDLTYWGILESAWPVLPASTRHITKFSVLWNLSKDVTELLQNLSCIFEFDTSAQNRLDRCLLLCSVASCMDNLKEPNFKNTNVQGKSRWLVDDVLSFCNFNFQCSSVASLTKIKISNYFVQHEIKCDANV